MDPLVDDPGLELDRLIDELRADLQSATASYRMEREKRKAAEVERDALQLRYDALDEEFSEFVRSERG